MTTPATRHWSDPNNEGTPDQLSIAYYTEQGYTLIEKERRGKFGNTYDVMGFADGLFSRNGTLLAAQWTTGTNFSSRLKKVLASWKAKKWVQGGGKVEVLGWRILKRGGERMEPVKREILLEDFSDA